MQITIIGDGAQTKSESSDKIGKSLQSLQEAIEGLTSAGSRDREILATILSRVEALSNFDQNYLRPMQGLLFESFSKISRSGFGELQILCDKYGTDKGSLFCADKSHPYPWQAHSYASIYELLLAPKRKRVKYVFECGIGSTNPRIKSHMATNSRPGASLFVWEEYFRNSISGVYGADIDRNVLFNAGKIRTFYMDQTDRYSVNDYFKNIANIRFDLMIDDGLHTSEAAICLFENSIGFLKADGLYFIEDMDRRNITDLYEYFKNSDYDVNYIIMPNGPGSDNSLTVIAKRDS